MSRKIGSESQHYNDQTRMKYDRFSPSQIIIQLADLTSRELPEHTDDELKETIDVLVDRSLNAEGLRSQSQGEFFKSLADFIGKKPHEIEDLYRQIGPIKNQYEKIVATIKEVERRDKNYFNLDNLISKFGEAEGKSIHGKYKIIMTDKNGKGCDYHDFIKKSKSQETDLWMMSLEQGKQTKNAMFPETSTFKTGKHADRTGRKNTKYIMEKTILMQGTWFDDFDAYLPIAAYLEDEEKATQIPMMTTVLGYADHQKELKAIKRRHKAYKESDKRLRTLKIQKEKKQEEYRVLYKGRMRKAQKIELMAAEEHIREQENVNQNRFQRFKAKANQYKTVVEDNSRGLDTEDRKKLTQEIIYLIGGLGDFRGRQDAMNNEYDIRKLENHIKRRKNYIAGSYEDHKSKEENETSYDAIHYKQRAKRFEYDPARKDYSESEKLEIQLLSIDSLVKEMMGLFNHTDYEAKKETNKKTFKEKGRATIYNNLKTRFGWATAGLEEAFNEAAQTRKYPHNNEEDYERSLNKAVSIIREARAAYEKKHDMIIH